MANLYGKLHSNQTTPEYSGSITTTTTTIVDNAKREIRVDVSQGIIDSINQQNLRLEKLAVEIAKKADNAEVDSLGSMITQDYINADARIERSLMIRILELEDLVDKLVPIDIEMFQTISNSVVEVGTYFTELPVQAKFNKTPKKLTINIDGIESDIPISQDFFQDIFKSSYDSKNTSCIIDFGEDEQGVTDQFFNILNVIGKQIQ